MIEGTTVHVDFSRKGIAAFASLLTVAGLVYVVTIKLPPQLSGVVWWKERDLSFGFTQPRSYGHFPSIYVPHSCFPFGALFRNVTPNSNLTFTQDITRGYCSFFASGEYVTPSQHAKLKRKGKLKSKQWPIVLRYQPSNPHFDSSLSRCTQDSWQANLTRDRSQEKEPSKQFRYAKTNCTFLNFSRRLLLTDKRFVGKRFVFLGDSHTRNYFNRFVVSMRGFKYLYEAHGMEKQHHPEYFWMNKTHDYFGVLAHNGNKIEAPSPCFSRDREDAECIDVVFIWWPLWKNYFDFDSVLGLRPNFVAQSIWGHVRKQIDDPEFRQEAEIFMTNPDLITYVFMGNGWGPTLRRNSIFKDWISGVNQRIDKMNVNVRGRKYQKSAKFFDWSSYHFGFVSPNEQALKTWHYACGVKRFNNSFEVSSITAFSECTDWADWNLLQILFTLW